MATKKTAAAKKLYIAAQLNDYDVHADSSIEEALNTYSRLARPEELQELTTLPVYELVLVGNYKLETVWKKV